MRKRKDDQIQCIDDQITENLISTQRRQLEKELKDMKNRKGKSAVILISRTKSLERRRQDRKQLQ